MTISEPMTLLTDYLLGAVAWWLGWKLSKSSQRSQRWWAYAFGALALGAFLGGTWHGFVRSQVLWTQTVIAVGFASFAMLVATAFAMLSGAVRKVLITLAALKLMIYTVWMLRHDEFIYVVMDTGISFAAVAALHLWRFNRWIVAGVAVSVAAALVQASGFSLHRHFNHNDLYHVIQIAAMVLLYRGARQLRDA
jgi:hypothetical protein